MKIDIDKQLQVLKPEKRNLVLGAFAPIVLELNELAESYPEIQEMEQTPERSDKAKRFRIDLRKAINKADKMRKDLKDESLQEGRAIQSVFNHIKEVTDTTSAEVISIENYYINLELAKKEKLRKERMLELEKYEMDGTSLNLGEMESAIWENFLLGAKRGYEEKQQFEKEEAERIAEEKRLHELENKRIREENEKLRIENEKAEAQRLAEKKKADDKLKKEREEREKLEAEIAEKKRIEAEKIRLEKEAEKQKANASDSEKLIDLITEIKVVHNKILNTFARDLLREFELQLNDLIRKM